ncbi:MAG TPA: PfkB family carbohydrate kinase [Solirubrobacteraceae bacterium]
MRARARRGAEAARFDYVTVGHVTVDVLAGRRQPGGGAFYSALQAARLGLRTQIVTRGEPAELEALLAPYRGELEISIVATDATTTLETWGRGHARKQRLLAWAGAFEEPLALDAAILHLAPIARETPRSWRGEVELVGLTPQGLVRAWDARGDISRVALTAEQLPARCDAAVLSTGERESCDALFTGATPGAVLAVTAGALPTRIVQADHAELEVPPSMIAMPRDDLGAGDVFAAAFFVALHEGLSPTAAAAHGNAAAGVRIAGAGPDAIGDRRAIQARL